MNEDTGTTQNLTNGREVASRVRPHQRILGLETRGWGVRGRAGRYVGRMAKRTERMGEK